jgi:hypothetical protein
MSFLDLSSALTLLVPGVFTNHPYGATPPDDLTFVADLLYAGSNLHGIPQSELCDDLPAVRVVSGGANLYAISNDESAKTMFRGQSDCCEELPTVHRANCV